MKQQSPHGGPGRGQGRHEEPGYSKTVKLRFLDEEEELAIKQFTPRQRVEILLAALSSRKPNKSLNAELPTAANGEDTAPSA